MTRDKHNASEPVILSIEHVAESDLGLSPSAEDVVSGAEVSAIVAKAVAAMRSEIRAAWEHKLGGDTDEFAAEQLGIGRATYQRRVAQAREILKDALRAAD